MKTKNSLKYRIGVLIGTFFLILTIIAIYYLPYDKNLIYVIIALPIIGILCILFFPFQEPREYSEHDDLDDNLGPFSKYL